MHQRYLPLFYTFLLLQTTFAYSSAPSPLLAIKTEFLGRNDTAATSPRVQNLTQKIKQLKLEQEDAFQKKVVIKESMTQLEQEFACLTSKLNALNQHAEELILEIRQLEASLQLKRITTKQIEKIDALLTALYQKYKVTLDEIIFIKKQLHHTETTYKIFEENHKALNKQIERTEHFASHDTTELEDIERLKRDLAALAQQFGFTENYEDYEDFSMLEKAVAATIAFIKNLPVKAIGTSAYVPTLKFLTSLTIEIKTPSSIPLEIIKQLESRQLKIEAIIQLWNPQDYRLVVRSLWHVQFALMATIFCLKSMDIPTI